MTDISVISRMSLRCALKFSLICFILQVAINILAVFLGVWINRLLGDLYWPFVRIGLILDGSSGSSGHAMQGGGILGYLIGILVYSLLIGVAICFFKEWHRGSE